MFPEPRFQRREIFANSPTDGRARDFLIPSWARSEIIKNIVRPKRGSTWFPLRPD